MAGNAALRRLARGRGEVFAFCQGIFLFGIRKKSLTIKIKPIS